MKERKQINEKDNSLKRRVASRGRLVEGERYKIKEKRSVNDLRRIQIFPINGKSLISNKLKRMLIKRLKLVNLFVGKPGKQLPVTKRQVNVVNVPFVRSLRTEGLIPKIDLLHQKRRIRGLVPMIPGKPKIEPIKMQPLKDGEKVAKIQQPEKIEEKMQEDKIADVDEIKLQKMKRLDKVPEVNFSSEVGR